MNGKQLIDRFQLNDQLIINQQINTVGTFDGGSFVTDRQHVLWNESNTPTLQLNFKTRLIS